MGSCELPNASRSSVDTRADKGELRGGMCVSKGWKSPHGMGAKGDVRHSLGISYLT